MMFLYSKKYALFWLLPAFFLSGFTSKDKLSIIENGKTTYEINVKQNSAQASAEILQLYLKKISGVTIPINPDTGREHAIILGIDPGLDRNQIVYEVKNNHLIIKADTEISLKHAVYDFLERQLGCRWLSPTVDKIPHLKTINVALDLSYQYSPAITTRTVHSKLFYDNPDFAHKLKVTTESFPYYVPTARVHTFHRFLPEDKFYASNPEYFAWRGEKRLPTQLCLTNPDVFYIVKDSVAAYFSQYPEASVISVSQDDNQQYCLCENCSALDKAEGSHAGSLIHFVNRIAKAFPEKIISTLAYQYTRKAPETKPERNVLITLCSIECDRSGPIEEKCQDFAGDLRDWNALGANVRIWDYTTQFTNFLAPFPNLLTIQPNIQFFRNNNAQWVFEQHSHHPSELFELRSYITAKLLWEPDRDFENLLTEFTDGYYEEAGVFIKKYIDLIHAALKENPDFFLFLYGDPSQAFDSWLKPDLLSAYDEFFDKAESVVKHKPEVLKRIREARLSVDYAILEAYKKNISLEFGMLSADGRSVNPEVLKRLSRFHETCQKANITLMNEMRFNVEDYIKNYKNTIKVASQPNLARHKQVTLASPAKKYAKEDPQTLTDGAIGGNSFYANWLGFEGNNLEAVIDLGSPTEIKRISTAFLQVTNHVVFFPEKVSFSYSLDGVNFEELGEVMNDEPLTKESKVNDIKYFTVDFSKIKARFIKVYGQNMAEPPYWHHAAGTSAWIFADEILVE